MVSNMITITTFPGFVDQQAHFGWEGQTEEMERLFTFQKRDDGTS